MALIRGIPPAKNTIFASFAQDGAQGSGACALSSISKTMARPTFLVVEKEPGAALSTRKLVLETAKFNVITAHTVKEALEFLRLAPNLYSAVIVNTEMPGIAKLINQVRAQDRAIAVISLSPNRSTSPKSADHHISSHEPEELADLCRELFGDPRKSEKQ